MFLTMQQLEIVHGLEQEDFYVHGVGGSGKNLLFCEHAFATRKKQRIEELKTQKRSYLRGENKSCWKLNPKSSNFLIPILSSSTWADLYFNHVVDHDQRIKHLLCHPFGGRWEPKVDPHDGSVFIDRDSTIFGMILNYLRTGTTELDDMT